MRISAAIPTYGRNEVLVDTIEALIRLQIPPDEILILDQTPRHSEPSETRLRELHAAGLIRWLRLEVPSIPRSMNRAFIEATGDLVLFLDDDIIPRENLVESHRRAYLDETIWAVVGQVLQPGEREIPPPPRRTHHFWPDLEFAFNQSEAAFVENVMAGNLSVLRERAIQIGGFDENYVAVAHRFETDFALRLVRAGGRIRFEPRASIHHLKETSGGTRAHGNQFTSGSPAHSVGDYYFALMTLSPLKSSLYCVLRILRSVRTKFHLTHPWWIPVKLIGEVRGLALALRLRARGRSLLTVSR